MPEIEYYQLSNGQVIEDADMSEMMYRIMNLKPHTSFVYSWDDIGMATLMSDLYHNNIRYCPQNDCWYVWDKCWQKQGENGAISDKLQTLLNLLILRQNLLIKQCNVSAVHFKAIVFAVEKGNQFINQTTNTIIAIFLCW